jgi:hypothetical protein
MIVLSTSVWRCRFLLFHEDKEEEEVVVGMVVGMKYLVSLADVGL